jgi:hypothetical protein
MKSKSASLLIPKLHYYAYKHINQLNITTGQIFKPPQRHSAQQKLIQFQWIPSNVHIDGNERVDESAKIATMPQANIQPVTSLEVDVLALNKIITQNWKNKMSNSNVRNSYKLNVQHTDPSVYKNIPTA